MANFIVKMRGTGSDPGKQSRVTAHVIKRTMYNQFNSPQHWLTECGRIVAYESGWHERADAAERPLCQVCSTVVAKRVLGAHRV